MAGLSALESDVTGTGHFQDAVWLNQIQEGLHFVGVTRHLDIQGLRSDVDNACAEDLTNLHDLGTLGWSGADLQHDKLAFSCLAAGEFCHVDNVDQLVDLLDRLIQRVAIAQNRCRNARKLGIRHGSHIERFDIKAAAAEHASDSGEDTELIFNEDGDDVAHNKKGPFVNVDPF